MSLCFIFFFFFFFLLSNPSASTAQKNLSSFSVSDSPWFPDQNRILLSPNSSFAAGFHPSSSSPQIYIFSIWYYNISQETIIWSINGRSPVNRSASLRISPSGELLLNFSGKNLWLPRAVGTPNATKLLLHDDGNLVYGNWTSFTSLIDTDSLLPDQPIIGERLVSKNGKFMFRNFTELVFNNSKDNYWSNGNRFQNFGSDGKLEKEDGSSIISSDLDEATTKFRRLTLDDDGNLKLYSYKTDQKQWVVVWQAVHEFCKLQGKCGPNYICMSDGFNGTFCVCPPGFREVQTSSGDGEKICEIKIPLSTLPQNNTFLPFHYVNFSGGSNQTDLKAPNFKTCESGCLSNPKCVGFGFKLDGKNYCVHQLDRLLYGYWSPGTETVMYIKVSKSETAESNFTGMTSVLETSCPVRISLPRPAKQSGAATRNLAIICSLFAIELISGVLAFWAFLKKYIKYRDMARTFGLELLPAGGPKRFTYAELKIATNDFSNVLGHGGFGIVYKGELPDHRVVAVKRLKDVGGGETEFWAEVTIIARMHHLNLVRMWGFCAEKSQRMLVYEYIPNGSLDKFLFPAVPRERTHVEEGNTSTDTDADTVRADQPRPILDWNIRYRIALGVARAIAYLHEECLEWVLHCDIKPENILLEDDFCPKVSDFGLSKLRKKEDKVSMSRIRGTRGYLAPEWVKMEPITAKADVYSFGMVLLEIVSGIRNFDFRRSSLDSEDWYFPRWAFEKVYKEKRVEDILDRQILHCYDSRAHLEMIDRMVKTAMWCLQDRADRRPSMGKVAKMLEGTVEITEPGKPTIFYLGDD